MRTNSVLMLLSSSQLTSASLSPPLLSLSPFCLSVCLCICVYLRERDVGIICVIIYDDLALEAWTQSKPKIGFAVFRDLRRKSHDARVCNV